MLRHLINDQRMRLFAARLTGGMLGPGTPQESILYGFPRSAKEFMRVRGLGGSIYAPNGPAEEPD